ncbi:MAG: hypothetical protein EZS28_005083 [Streblomastix strix]|uniref:Zinc finger Sec23/Sec24-type domain-containing protein n=1 Tax=Streblomastix strix TaxID=222440 RepID=A0A5J4WWI1_9EUKA|nr:MAG: hypothetical protein EZS28_005083 [Streblomastix strix]
MDQRGGLVTRIPVSRKGPGEDPLRCRSCMAYVSPFAPLIQAGTEIICPFYEVTNQVENFMHNSIGMQFVEMLMINMNITMGLLITHLVGQMIEESNKKEFGGIKAINGAPGASTLLSSLMNKINIRIEQGIT